MRTVALVTYSIIILSAIALALFPVAITLQLAPWTKDAPFENVHANNIKFREGKLLAVIKNVQFPKNSRNCAYKHNGNDVWVYEWTKISIMFDSKIPGTLITVWPTLDTRVGCVGYYVTAQKIELLVRDEKETVLWLNFFSRLRNTPTPPEWDLTKPAQKESAQPELPRRPDPKPQIIMPPAN